MFCLNLFIFIPSMNLYEKILSVILEMKC